jgi:hypothetical protein
VLRPGGWAAFQLSNDPGVHATGTPRSLSMRRIVGTLRRGPRGRQDPAWVGSAVSMADLRRVADGSGLALEQIVGEGTQFCGVRARRVGSSRADVAQ